MSLYYDIVQCIIYYFDFVYFIIDGIHSKIYIINSIIMALFTDYGFITVPIDGQTFIFYYAIVLYNI